MRNHAGDEVALHERLSRGDEMGLFRRTLKESASPVSPRSMARFASTYGGFQRFE